LNINKIENIYFIGIGGIGMSAVARYFVAQGKNVAGYDRTPTPLTAQLQAEGIAIHFVDDVEKIAAPFLDKNNCLIVYTPAIPKTHKELNYFQDADFQIVKRAKVLGLISAELRSIAVAGTHGKTSISTLTAHLLKQSAVDCSAFLGGIAKNYATNYLINRHKDHHYMVLEADEFDKSFLQLHPQTAVISSLDADHLDIYGDHKSLQQAFNQFVTQIQAGGTLIYKKGLPLQFPEKVKAYSYALHGSADFYAENIRQENGRYYFDWKSKEKTIKNLTLSGLQGLINIENAVAAIAAATFSGVKSQEIAAALAQFEGIKRRFEYLINTENLVYIDDYAHHPAELKAVIASVRELYPDKKIMGVFQPHLYSRTRDFAAAFAQSLDLLDNSILLDIYPARELPIKGVSSELIFRQMNLQKKQMCTKENLPEVLQNEKPEVLLTLGAGDIDKLVKPIREMLKVKS